MFLLAHNFPYGLNGYMEAVRYHNHTLTVDQFGWNSQFPRLQGQKLEEKN